MGRWLLFLSSYSPLFGLTAVRLQPGTFRTVTFAVAVLGALSLALALADARRIEPRERVVADVEDRGGDVAGYLATYLLPFLTVSSPSAKDAVAYAGFLLLVGVVYTRSSLLAVNPLLYLLGYRLSHVTTEGGQRVLLIYREFPARHGRIRCSSLFRDPDICLEAR
jgi:hypothetical protein